MQAGPTSHSVGRQGRHRKSISDTFAFAAQLHVGEHLANADLLGVLLYDTDDADEVPDELLELFQDELDEELPPPAAQAPKPLAKPASSTQPAHRPANSSGDVPGTSGIAEAAQGLDAGLLSSRFATQTRANALDPSQLDPKRAKRIIANRQSAHRSRMKKLQYMHDLEGDIAATKEATRSMQEEVVRLGASHAELVGSAHATCTRIAELRAQVATQEALAAALAQDRARLKAITQELLAKKARRQAEQQAALQAKQSQQQQQQQQHPQQQQRHSQQAQQLYYVQQPQQQQQPGHQRRHTSGHVAQAHSPSYPASSPSHQLGPQYSNPLAPTNSGHKRATAAASPRAASGTSALQPAVCAPGTSAHHAPQNSGTSHSSKGSSPPNSSPALQMQSLQLTAHCGAAGMPAAMGHGMAMSGPHGMVTAAAYGMTGPSPFQAQQAPHMGLHPAGLAGPGPAHGMPGMPGISMQGMLPGGRPHSAGMMSAPQQPLQQGSAPLHSMSAFLQHAALPPTPLLAAPSELAAFGLQDSPPPFDLRLLPSGSLPPVLEQCSSPGPLPLPLGQLGRGASMHEGSPMQLDRLAQLPGFGRESMQSMQMMRDSMQTDRAASLDMCGLPGMDTVTGMDNGEALGGGAGVAAEPHGAMGHARMGAMHGSGTHGELAMMGGSGEGLGVLPPLAAALDALLPAPSGTDDLQLLMDAA